MSYPDFVSQFWQDIAGWAVLIDSVLTLFTIACVLHLKREPMSAIAWCLTVIVLPFLGPALFGLFGYQTISRPIKNRRKKREVYKKLTSETLAETKPGDGTPPVAIPHRWELLAKLAHHREGFPPDRR